MLWKRKTKCTEACVVALLLALHWAQTEASPLKRNIQQHGEKEGTGTTERFQPGIIVFGDPRNASAEVDPSFQADGPGFGDSRAFYDMSPTLECGNNGMKFSAFGRSVGHFTLKQKPPMPLSDVPPACGYSIEGFPYRLVLHVPYDGCNIDIEGGYYNLPMFWKTYTVKLMCPRPDDGGDPTPPPMNPWYYWYMYKYFLWYYYYHMHHDQTPSMPTTSPAPQDPMMMMYYLLHKHPIPFPSLPTSPPQNPMMYYGYHLHKYPFPSIPTSPPQNPMMYYLYHKHKFPFPGMPTPPAPADPVPQIPQYFKYFQQHQHTHKFPFQDFKNPFDPTTTPATATTMPCFWCDSATP